MSKRRFYLALVIFALTGQVAWVVENMYFNVFIYKMFNASASDISLMVQASAVAATLTTIFIGALSDRLQKRKIFMCLGYVLWGISILAFALIRLDLISAAFGKAANTAAIAITAVIILDCVMTFFGSSANDAAYNAWLTDRTDETNRGRAEGINSMMPLIAILIVFGGFMGFDLNLASSWTIIYVIIGAAVLLIGVLGFFIVEDAPAKKADDCGYMATILYGFRPSVIRKNSGLYFTLIGFIVFGISIQVFMPYLIIYYEQTLGMSDYVLIMAPAIILAAVVTVLYGKLIDRFGFEKTVLPSLGMLILGYILLFVFPGVISVSGLAMKAPVFIGSLLMMSGYLTGMAVFGAKIRNETPERMAGRFQGLRIIAQVLVPGVIGPAIGAAVLKNADTIVNNDGTTSFLPSNAIFLAALIVALVLTVLLVLYFTVKRRRSER
ncbi:MAG: MFS transporter [Clostridia bacterium]|nr:MFS transporter [Clostridia bacterium]MBQ5487686.1 MFS transporter [Clostridia bacterium]